MVRIALDSGEWKVLLRYCEEWRHAAKDITHSRASPLVKKANVVSLFAVTDTRTEPVQDAQ